MSLLRRIDIFPSTNVLTKQKYIFLILSFHFVHDVLVSQEKVRSIMRKTRNLCVDVKFRSRFYILLDLQLQPFSLSWICIRLRHLIMGEVIKSAIEMHSSIFGISLNYVNKILWFKRNTVKLPNKVWSFQEIKGERENLLGIAHGPFLFKDNRNRA